MTPAPAPARRHRKHRCNSKPRTTPAPTRLDAGQPNDSRAHDRHLRAKSNTD
jgi:hypothetical protein